MDEAIRITPDEWNAYADRGERYPLDRTRHYIFTEGTYNGFLGAGTPDDPPRLSELLNDSTDDH